MLPSRLQGGKARVLGEICDDRFPVSIDQWRAERGRCTQEFGAGDGYWCWVPETAGGAPGGFWIARYPVTVDQFRPFVEVGYGTGSERWWTAEGREWRDGSRRRVPWGWGEPRFMERNQPIIGVTWYEAAAFAAWLADATGEALRLPAETEWEAAAAYDGSGKPREWPWGSDPPEARRAVFAMSGRDGPAPVGTCPAGRAACGGLDFAGNMWEWTDVRQGEYSIRGGAFYSNADNLRCGARDGLPPDFDYLRFIGFRLVLSPRSFSS